jgi:2-polyprenyl-3-methyl-5-hydroxy-6-metoxy-1,4-benzoquinol methylase
MGRIWYLPEENRPFHILWCEACQYGTYTPRPTLEDLKPLYAAYFSREAPDQAHPHNSTVGSSPANPPALPILDRIRARLAWQFDAGKYVNAQLVHSWVGPAPKQICDLGAGPGRLLRALKDLGHHVAGVEPDPTACRAARAKDVDIHQGSVDDLPAAVRDQQYDAVTLVHVLEHCLDPVSAVSAAASLLRPGGYLFIEVPNNASLAAQRAGPTWFHADLGRHLNFFTPKSLAALIRSFDSDLELLRTGYAGYCLQFQNERIASEQQIWDRFVQLGESAALQGSTRTTKPQRWRQLLTTAIGDGEKKYEAVSVIAKKKNGAIAPDA